MDDAKCRFVGAGKHGWVLLLLGATLASFRAGSSLAAEAAAAAPQHGEQSTRLDEVIISGQLNSLSAVKRALIDNENRFNVRYNELNQDDHYDVVCRDEIPTGSRIPRRNCQARVVDEITTQESQDFFRNLGTGPGLWIARPDLLREQAMGEVKERTRALVLQDPELKQTLLEHSRLEQMYRKLSRKESRRLFRRD